MKSIIGNLLAHPLTAGLDINDPKTTELRRGIIKSKPFLLRIYDQWYQGMAAHIPPGEGDILEIGSGGGFLREYVPRLITSDILACRGVDRVFDACIKLPFADNSLKAVLMLNVFHHLSDSETFLDECVRCLRPGGEVIMVEPWVSPWSRLVYTKLHHEPFDPACHEWRVISSGALSGANGALPWIVFERDRVKYHEKYPMLTIERVTPMMPVCYLVSGGVSMRSLMPGFAYPLFSLLEYLLTPFVRYSAMFARIKLRKG